MGISENRMYVAIDSKSFYASVECMKRGLDPLTTNLVVADASRTEKTICLAVSPSLKSHGISGRARLFEVVQKIREANAERKLKAPGQRLLGKTTDAKELNSNPALAIDYLVAPPRMALYMEYSTKIYQIYLKYVAPEDIHVYSIDEVFIDVTEYLQTYRLTARELTVKMIQDVYQNTGITATGGIGTNLYLCKIAMDIVAKHVEANIDGVRIAELDEISYRRILWAHRPLTDFWRIGRGYRKKLEEHGLYTLGDIARCSLGKPGDYHNEELLYKLFGINAELLIDHAWGWEPCTMADIKSYKPQTNSIGSGQVLQYPYESSKAKLVVQEMAEQLVLDLVDKGLVTTQIELYVGYDIENLTRSEISKSYHGPVISDHYGRRIPKQAHGTANLDRPTSSTKQILNLIMALFDRIVDEKLLIRRLNITANHVVEESCVKSQDSFEQMDMFTDYEAVQKRKVQETLEMEREKRMQNALLDIKKKYGKNAILKASDLEDGATAAQRNNQIGGHKAY